MHLRKALSFGACMELGRFSKTLLTGALIGVTALAMPLAGNAQVLTIMITDNLGHSLTVADGSANDSNPAANAVSVDTALLAAFPNLTGQSNVTAAFNQPLGTQSRLTTTGDLFGATASTITVTSSINGVVIPNTLFGRQFNSTSTISFNNSAGTSGTDTNGVDTGNVLFGMNRPDTPFAYASTGTLPNSGAGDGNGFLFFNGGAPYAITSRTVIMVIPSGESQYTTNSIVQASPVPEPGAFAMFAGLGVTGSLIAVRRLRRNRK